MSYVTRKDELLEKIKSASSVHEVKSAIDYFVENWNHEPKVISEETIQKLTDLIVQYNFCEKDILSLCEAGALLGNNGVRGEQAGERLREFFISESEPKAPTHEEIMSRWWKMWDGSWCRVYAYLPNDNGCYGLLISEYLTEDERPAKYRSFVNKEYFIGRESADIPPEAP